MLVRRLAGPVAAIAAAALAAPALGLPASAPTCRPAQLRLEASFYGEAGGQFLQTFTFTNASRRECALKGWPTVAPEGRSGRPQRARSLRVIQTAPTVHAVAIGSGAAASFDVYGADWNHLADRPCPQTTAALVRPPGAHTGLSVAVAMPNCGRLYVAPIVAGRTDRESWTVVWSK